VRSKLSAEQIERLKNVPLDILMRTGMGGGPGGPGGQGGFRPGGPDGQRPDGQRYNPDNPQRRPRGDAPGDERPRRPAPESEPK
jgi:translation initiation factor IF-2